MELWRDKLLARPGPSRKRISDLIGADTFSRTVDWRICPETDQGAFCTLCLEARQSTYSTSLASLCLATSRQHSALISFSCPPPLTARPARGPRCLSLESVTSTGRAAEAIQDMALEPNEQPGQISPLGHHFAKARERKRGGRYVCPALELYLLERGIGPSR